MFYYVLSQYRIKFIQKRGPGEERNKIGPYYNCKMSLNGPQGGVCNKHSVYTDKKHKNQIYLIHKEIQNGAAAKS